MKIYFAGNTMIAKRERALYELGCQQRLLSFFYLESLELFFEVVKDEDIFRRRTGREQERERESSFVIRSKKSITKFFLSPFFTVDF